MSNVKLTALNGQGKNSLFAYFFRGNQYMKYSWEQDKAVEGYPKPLELWNLKGKCVNGIDACCNGIGEKASKSYFFKDDEYVRYDWDNDAADPEYPLPISIWGLPEGFTDNIDAILQGSGESMSKIFFFKGNQYVSYDLILDRPTEGYPRPISDWNFPDSIEAIVEGKAAFSGKYYLFKGTDYMRFDWNNRILDAGYPLNAPSAFGIQSLWVDFGPNHLISTLENQLVEIANYAYSLLDLSIPSAKNRVFSTEIVSDPNNWCGNTLAHFYRQSSFDKVWLSLFQSTQGLLNYGSYYTLDIYGRIMSQTKKTEILIDGNWILLKDYHNSQNSLRKVILYTEIQSGSVLDIVPGDIVLLDHEKGGGPDHIQIVVRWDAHKRILYMIDGNGLGFKKAGTSTTNKVLNSNPDVNGLSELDKVNMLHDEFGDDFVLPISEARVGISCIILDASHQTNPKSLTDISSHKRVFAIIRPSQVDFENHQYQNVL